MGSWRERNEEKNMGREGGRKRGDRWSKEGRKMRIGKNGGQVQKNGWMERWREEGKKR